LGKERVTTMKTEQSTRTMPLYVIKASDQVMQDQRWQDQTLPGLTLKDQRCQELALALAILPGQHWQDVHRYDTISQLESFSNNSSQMLFELSTTSDSLVALIGQPRILLVSQPTLFHRVIEAPHI
jgi:hypothetical protein